VLTAHSAPCVVAVVAQAGSPDEQDKGEPMAACSRNELIVVLAASLDAGFSDRITYDLGTVPRTSGIRRIRQ
jgi:hypothetical protein